MSHFIYFVTLYLVMLSVAFYLLLRQMLCFIYRYAECHYAECRYADCHYDLLLLLGIGAGSKAMIEACPW